MRVGTAIRRGVCAATVTILVLVFLAVQGPRPAGAADFDLARLKEGGYVVLLRHAKAGGSDADNFDLRNCRTQRQVAAPGRKQMTALVARFEAASITEARVVSSQFCRALQTAELLDLGPVTEEPRLNFFHWRLGDEAAMTRNLRDFLVELTAGDASRPLILVTHSHAFKEIGAPRVKSGGGVILKPNGTAKPDVVGRITAPD